MILPMIHIAMKLLKIIVFNDIDKRRNDLYLTINISFNQLGGIDQLKQVLVTGPVNTHTDWSIVNLASL